MASPESQTPRPEGAEGLTAIGDDGYNEFTIHGDESRQTSFQQLRTHRANANGMNDLHPYVQTLSLSNLESCVALENAVFPEHERCSREKVGLSNYNSLKKSNDCKIAFDLSQSFPVSARFI